MSSLDDLEDGKEYVCGGKGEVFKKIEYSKTDHNKSKRLSSGRLSGPVVAQPRIAPPDCVRPRIVTLIRNGIKPRKVTVACDANVIILILIYLVSIRL